MPLFSQQQVSAFGLDISELSLKIAKLEKTGQGFRLSSFGSAEIPKGIIVDSKVEDGAALAKLIRRGLNNVKGKRIKDKHVIASLPEEKSFIDILRVPYLEKKEELTEAVKFEAANQIPMGIDDVYFDFEEVDGADKEKKYKEVLISATPKEIVDSYLASIKKAGLRTQAMEIECSSIVRSLIKDGASKKPLLLIDFGETRTSFMIFSGTSLRFTSTIPVSSQSLTESIIKYLKLSQDKADKLKQEEGLTGQKRVSEALSQVLSDLANQIITHLSYYRSHTFKNHHVKNGTSLAKILLCGGGSNLKGMPDFLSSKLNMPVELGNPWVNILPSPLKEVPALPFEKSLSYATALGLALRSFK